MHVADGDAVAETRCERGVGIEAEAGQRDVDAGALRAARRRHGGNVELREARDVAERHRGLQADAAMRGDRAVPLQGGAVVEAVFARQDRIVQPQARSEEHTSELQSLMRISYAVFCLKKKKI